MVKFIKRFRLRIGMILIFMLLASVVNAATDVTIDNIKYALNGTEAYVVGYEGSPANITIPEKITVSGSTFNVTEISSNAFDYCKSLVTLKADYMRYIGIWAFRDCVNLKTVSIENIRHIAWGVFQNCEKLEKVNLGYHAVSLGAQCFENCTSLKYIVIPSGSVSGEPSNYTFDWQFNGCSMLQSIIYLGKSLGKLSSNANVYTAKDLVEWSDSSYVYTGLRPNPSYTNKAPAGFQVTSCTPSELNHNAGEYTDSLLFTFANSDMDFQAKIPYHYTIAKAKLSAKVQDAIRTYGDANPQFSVQYSGFVNGESKEVLDNPGVISTSAIPTSPAGKYQLSLTGAEDNNYDTQATPGTLTVSKAQLTAKAANKTRPYGSENPQLTLEYTGLKNNESSPEWIVAPTLSTDAQVSSPAGAYPILVSGGTAKNYDVTFGKGTMTVSKAALKISANNASRLYFEDNPKFTCSYTGFVNGEDASVLTKQPVITTTATAQSKCGNYGITVGQAESPNYSITYESGNLEVRKRTLNVSTGNYTRPYGEENPNFDIEYNGFVNNETEKDLVSKPIVKTEATKTSDTGTYTLILEGGVADNYDFVYTNGSLIIEKAYQEITWNQDLSNVEQYSQIELSGQASSKLPITYTLDNDTVCSIQIIGDKTYLDCFGTGKVVIAAKQLGNGNYYPTTKSYKLMTVVNTTGISTTRQQDVKNRIRISHGKLVVEGMNADDVLSVYTLSGQTIYRGKNTEIQLPAGSYIVRIGTYAQKFIIR